jgi:hypothetical protein
MRTPHRVSRLLLLCSAAAVTVTVACRSRDGSILADTANAQTNPSGTSGGPDDAGTATPPAEAPPAVLDHLSFKCIDGNTAYFVVGDLQGTAMTVTVTIDGNPAYVVTGQPILFQDQRARAYFRQYTLAGGSSPLREIVFAPESLAVDTHGRLDVTPRSAGRTRRATCEVFDPENPNGAGVSN